ncbi:MAG: hypothetical protein PHR44_07530 [Candidatus Omnitrophica bacterium]|nr:hypothetical protein [Candidatus Omnitrophota bacterium]
MTINLSQLNSLLEDYKRQNNLELDKTLHSAENMLDACNKIANSWSGSFAGWHGRMYFGDFDSPPLNKRFSVEWGDIHGLPNGWGEKSADEVKTMIEKLSGSNFSIDKFESKLKELFRRIVEVKDEIELIFLNYKFDSDTKEERKVFYQIKNFVFEKGKKQAFIQSRMPKSIMTRDSNALSQGMLLPSHIYYECVAQEGIYLFNQIKDFIELSIKLYKRLSLKHPTQSNKNKCKLGVKFVNEDRIKELQSINSKEFDLSKLIKFCEELNMAFENEAYFSVILLTRAIIDHVPPLLNVKNFTEVANNYNGTKSFKESMLHLENSSRKIADSCLHSQVRKREVLPTVTQVDFSNDLDVLLSEVCRILK